MIENNRAIERNVQRQDGSAHYLMRIVPYHAHNNLVDGALVTFVDVTKMVEAENQQRTLVEELNHRVRNMLTVVGVVARQTLAKARSPEQFSESFLARIQAMANTYSLVSRHNWSSISLRDIVVTELQPYLPDREERIAVRGPTVVFEASHALALGLVFHELATNAIKYGALSNDVGHLDVNWGLRNDRLELHWHESGQPLAATPHHRGFGTELIERQVGMTFRGSVTFDYGHGGLHVTLAFPYRR